MENITPKIFAQKEIKCGEIYTESYTSDGRMGLERSPACNVCELLDYTIFLIMHRYFIVVRNSDAKVIFESRKFTLQNSTITYSLINGIIKVSDNSFIISWGSINEDSPVWGALLQSYIYVARGYTNLTCYSINEDIITEGNTILINGVTTSISSMVYVSEGKIALAMENMVASSLAEGNYPVMFKLVVALIACNNNTLSVIEKLQPNIETNQSPYEYIAQATYGQSNSFWSRIKPLCFSYENGKFILMVRNNKPAVTDTGKMQIYVVDTKGATMSFGSPITVPGDVSTISNPNSLFSATPSMFSNGESISKTIVVGTKVYLYCRGRFAVIDFSSQTFNVINYVNSACVEQPLFQFCSLINGGFVVGARYFMQNFVPENNVVGYSGLAPLKPNRFVRKKVTENSLSYYFDGSTAGMYDLTKFILGLSSNFILLLHPVLNGGHYYEVIRCSFSHTEGILPYSSPQTLATGEAGKLKFITAIRTTYTPFLLKDSYKVLLNGKPLFISDKSEEFENNPIVLAEGDVLTLDINMGNPEGTYTATGFEKMISST